MKGVGVEEFVNGGVGDFWGYWLRDGFVSTHQFDFHDLDTQGDKGNPLSVGEPLTFGCRHFLGISGLWVVSRHFDQFHVFG